MDGIGISEECHRGCRIPADFFSARDRLEQLCGSLHFGPVPAVYFQLISGGLDRYTGRTRFPFDGSLLYPGRRILFLVIVSTLMIPVSITLIPTFIIVRSLGWLDTYWALIVPALFNAFGIFLLRQFYLSLPLELEEAARIDGASPAGVFLYIALPLSRPILATLAVFFWLANWNSYLWPLIVTQSPEMRVIQLGIASFAGEHSTQWQLIMAGSTVAAIPGLILYVFLQNFLIEGIKMTGLK